MPQRRVPAARSEAVLLCLIVLVGCASASHGKLEAPPTPRLDLSRFRRVWIAGFLTRGTSEFDVNAETVRLLRQRLRPRTLLSVVEAEPVTVRDEAELRDAQQWKRRAEEYQEPLIVTGSIRLRDAAPVAVERIAGRGAAYTIRKGFVLDVTFHFIDGRTGEVMASQGVPAHKLYGSDQRESALSLFYQLMDRVLPAFFRVFGGETVIGAVSQPCAQRVTPS